LEIVPRAAILWVVSATHPRPPAGGPDATAPCDDAVVAVDRARFDSGGAATDQDLVAREEPLEIQLGAGPLAVVMRTPGHDVELATGLLLTERVIRGPGDLASVHPCPRADTPDAQDNVVRAVLAPHVTPDLEALRRNLFASSSCGVCGKATLANALAHAPPLEDDAVFPAGFFGELPGRLRQGQAAFAHTGGLHAAALFAPSGECLVVREDVGRHNAVDKVVGWAVRTGRLPLAGHVLMVSGRISYEIVQKALAARVPLVAAVSAPSSLAVRLADEARIALVAFLRGSRFAVYGARDRVAARPGTGPRLARPARDGGDLG
jgi:FdhD protein